MGLTHDDFALGVKEAVVTVIECNWNVPTGIFIGKELPFESPHEPLLRTFVMGEGKLHCFPFLNFIDDGNSYA